MREAPVRLRCEYQDNPLGLDTARPRVSWWLNDSRPAELQTAYQIQAASSATGLQAGTADLWDTGHVSSQQTLNVEYRGRPLNAGDHAWWRVRCYDSDGTPSPWSDPARFEIGPAHADGLRGQWIDTPLVGSPSTAMPVPLIFRDFVLSHAPVSARLHYAVLGSADLSLNGRRLTPVAAMCAAPDPAHRAVCQTLDVTASVRAGANRLGVLLGDGDYCGHLAGGPRQRHGERPAVSLQLVLELGGGERQVIVSDADWLWRPSWILYADRDRGEEVDGRRYPADWCLPETPGDGYPVRLAEHPDVVVVAAGASPGVVLAEHADARLLQRWRGPDGHSRVRFDLGRVVAGRARLVLQARRNTTLRVRYGLAVPPLRPDAAAAETSAIRWESGEDRYTCRGDGEEWFEPTFALHLFRYVELDFDMEPVEIVSLLGVELGAAAPPAAGFECDHTLLEQYFSAAAQTCRWGLLLGPVAGLAPDQRTVAVEDAAALLTGAAACLDVAAGFRSWLASAGADTGAGATPGATESLLACLWFAYRSYGDRRLLEQTYPVVQAYLRRRRDAAAAEPGRVAVPERMLSEAWHAFELSLATRMAGVLGRLSDLEAYDVEADAARREFRERYVSAHGLLVSDDQLGYLLALELGVLDETARAVALERLEAQLRRDGFHGSVDARHGGLLLEVLTLEGRLDLAYQVLLQTTAPGWLHPLHAGAGMLWDTATDVPGRLAAACLAGWLQRFLLGLELDDNLTPELNAYRRMRIQPRPPLGPEFGAGVPVGRAAGYLDTVHGRFECRWTLDDEAFQLTVRVPGNCSARVVLPDGSERLVMAGAHEFTQPLQAEPGGRHGEESPVLREISGSR
jgi:alpha-L-rhamnosidase